MSNDIRVLLIKLADRRHNLTTISVLENRKAKRIARETLEIYAPLALRLGIHNLSTELENLSFKTYYPLRTLLLSNILIRQEVTESYL